MVPPLSYNDDQVKTSSSPNVSKDTLPGMIKTNGHWRHTELNSGISRHVAKTIPYLILYIVWADNQDQL